jgi:hypothetical protein
MNMTHRHFAIVPLLVALSAPATPATGVRIILGLTDTASTKWDGGATARAARITSIEPWRFEGSDAINGNQWTISTHNIRLFGGQLAPPSVAVANGVIVWLDGESESSELQVKTPQGSFTVKLSEIPYGKPSFALNKSVMADRVPGVSRITNSPDEQDYPAAAADKNGTVWLAYMEFRHNKDHDRLRAPMKQAPADFSELKAPTGGDQILLRKYAGGAWSEPIAITEPGGDLYRPAIAVDGTGRPWVFWSANDKGNFDVWAKPVENDKPGSAVRLSSEAGSDIDATAATDSQGRVWVAWQGWRNGRASIFAATQNGNAFSKAAAVSNSKANEWNPAIAADSNGRVSVAWDSYRNGNYDVYVRTAPAPGKWGVETPVAATARYEAYPSIAYDSAGTLWIAYEEGAEKWGKDWGAYETSGFALYQGRATRLRGIDKTGRAVEANADPGSVLPGVPDRRVESENRQGSSVDWTVPNTDRASQRRPSATPLPPPAPKNTSPRLRVDSSGRLWLAVRSAQPIWWNPVGTVWSEYVVSYDGNTWTGPVFLAHSDNLLDNRPALVSARGGELLVIGSSDGRRQFHLVEKYLPNDGFKDPYNNDLYMNTLSLPPAPGAFSPKAAEKMAIAGVTAADTSEKATAAAMRAYKLKSAEGPLRIIRGEFHRHSEISPDGGGDGTILEQYRYMIDPAGMDWVGCCDHDNGAMMQGGGGREYSWWISQKLTDIFYSQGKFIPMFMYERSVQYPEGHRNVVFAQRGIRSLPRLPRLPPEAPPGQAPDTQMFYRYLKQFNGIVASHTSGTNMGTDWRDNDPTAEPVVEIYQGDRQNYEMPGAPRTNTDGDSIGGWRPKGFVDLALEKGYRLSFEASSDHISTHMSYCNILAKDGTRESLIDAFHKRHVYAATDDILADVRSGDHIMGDVFSTSTQPELHVKLAGTKPFAKVLVIKDGKYVYTAEPKTAKVEFSWKDTASAAGKTSYYYVRGEQEDGEIVWASPMWITYNGK